MGTVQNGCKFNEDNGDADYLSASILDWLPSCREKAMSSLSDKFNDNNNNNNNYGNAETRHY